MTTGLKQPITNEALGRKLRVAREAAALSQVKLAGLLGLDKRTVCSYEKGRIRIPAITLLELAKRLNRSVDEILGLEEVDGRTIEGKLKRKFLQLEQLSEQQQKAIIQFIDAFLAAAAEASGG